MKRFLSFAIALVMAFSFAAPALAAERPVWVDPDEEVLQFVESAEAVSIVKYLSEEIGVRIANSPEEMEAAEYILSKHNEYGYGNKADNPDKYAEIQMFDYPNTRYQGYITINNAAQYMDNPAVTFAGTSTLYGRPLPYDIRYNVQHGDVWSVGSGPTSVITGKDAKITGQVVFCGNGGNDAAFASAAGKIALVNVAPTAAIATRAQNAGAIGLIGYSTALGGRGNWSQVPNGNITMNANSTLVGAQVANIHGEWLRTMAATEGGLTVDFSTFAITAPQSPNVIAVKRAKNNPDTAPIIFVTSHIDSVKSSPGGNDNATGVAYALAAAKALANVNTDDVEIRFCSFGSEEVGLVGSNRYVASLTAEERARALACFNADMMAPKEYSHTKFLHVATANGVPNIASDAMLAAAERLGVISEVVQGYFPSSDHVPFHNAGIPAIMAIRHGPGVEGTRVISSVGSNYTVERGYHTPYDNFTDNVDADRMDLGCRLVTAAVYSMAVPAQFNLSTEAFLVESGDEFTIESKFAAVTDSNVAMIYYDYDTEKFDYVGFTPADGVTLIDAVPGEDGVQITVMKSGYAFENIGSLILKAKDGMENGHEKVTATVRYVVNANGEKEELLTGGNVSFTTYKLPESFSLIDLSDIVDAFGLDYTDPDWPTLYAFWDFNNNSKIDIDDISFVAIRIA